MKHDIMHWDGLGSHTVLIGRYDSCDIALNIHIVGDIQINLRIGQVYYYMIVTKVIRYGTYIGPTEIIEINGRFKVARSAIDDHGIISSFHSYCSWCITAFGNAGRRHLHRHSTIYLHLIASHSKLT